MVEKKSLVQRGTNFALAFRIARFAPSRKAVGQTGNRLSRSTTADFLQEQIHGMKCVFLFVSTNFLCIVNIFASVQILDSNDVCIVSGVSFCRFQEKRHVGEENVDFIFLYVTWKREVVSIECRDKVQIVLSGMVIGN
jgi:hypothetical protein